MPRNVWGGWKLDLCSRAWVSVGLKYTLVSNWCVWEKEGPLYVVVSRKSMVVGWMVDLRLMEGEWALRMVVNWLKASRECGQIPQISSK